MSEALYATDYDVWADYWDLVEAHGMNVDAVPALAPYLRDPVLLVGSGQGLVAHSLAAAGFDVVAVDSSPSMARKARDRRAVETVICDVVDLRLERRFGTALVSTGVVNERTIERGLLPELAARVREHVRPGGLVLLAYFRRSTWTHVAETLGIYGRPSTNTFFWTSQGDLEQAERLFADSSADPRAVHELFARHSVVLARHAAFIRRVGERCTALRRTAPEEFIRDHTGFYPYPLGPSSEARVIEALRDAGLVYCTESLLNGGDTNVVVLRYEAQ